VTSIETGPTWSERLNPRNWTLAWKLVVVGLVPALLALVLGVLRVSDQAGQAADLGRSSRLLEVQAQVAGASDALRQERDEATLFVAGNRTGDRGVLEIGFGQADGEVDEMLGAVRGTSELDATSLSALRQAEAALSQLTVLRTDAVSNPAVAAAQARARYDDVVQGVDVLDRALLRQLRTPGVAGLADALTAVTSATEQLAVQHTVLGAAIRASRVLPPDVTAVGATDSQLAADLREYRAALTPEQLTQFGNFLDDPANVQRERLKEAILATPENRPITLAPYEWDTAYNGSRAAADRSADLLRNELVAASTAAEEQASNLAGINSVVLMLGLLVGITVAILVARALIRSLRVLRTSALDVAERRLPQAVESMRAGETPDVTVDPVPLTGRDEVGQVARAFDAVHGQAIRLAADQAALQANVSAMFVNLSRRSQALVERQLQLIEQLESNEQDPDQLSNLFQLDHLATRMRRNSENLLVLAGTDLAKRNIAPVPMVDVLRAAVSEVEQYQRIVVQSPPTAALVGRAASDVVHLLAELLDNATNFSPPDSQVVMSTTRTADGSIVVEIADRGVGMIDHELSDANQRLGGPSAVDVSASRRMGLFVVGRLGARHGISVRLSASAAGGPGAGLTASVTVPAYLIPSGERNEAGRPLGFQQAAGVAAQSAPALGSPPQRAGMNGSGRTGSLSALVAGTDGPSNPASMFDGGPDVAGGQLFATPPPVNGTGGLPSRRPGSTLRPDGPQQPPEGRDPAEQAAADQAAAERAAEERAREVAEQARRDQEAAAERAAAERADADRGQEPEQDRRDGSFPIGSLPNGAYRNGVPPDAPRSDAPRSDAPRSDAPRSDAPRSDAPRSDAPQSDAPRSDVPRPDADQAGSPANGAVPPGAVGNGAVTDGAIANAAAANGTAPHSAGDDARTEDADVPADTGPEADAQVVQEQASADRTPAEEPAADEDQPVAKPPAAPDTGSFAAGSAFGGGARPQRGVPSPVPPSPPTTPMPTVGRRGPGPMAPRPPAARPAPQQQPGPRPYPQGLRPGQQGGPAAPVPPPPAPARRQVDGLFAPSVPVIAEPDGSTIGRGSGSADTQDRFERGETTPIFEEIASAWFRSNRPIPVNWETEKGEQTEAAQPQPPIAPRPPSPTPVPPPAPVAAEPTRQAVPVPDDAEPQPVSARASSEPGFASLADEGWRAASGVVIDRSDELTSAGLPKRRPRARLVPGSAGSAVLAPPVSPTRSAENIRGRLASYQQGVRQGRESRLRGGTGTAPAANSGTEPANAGGNHDEESS
jgi:signal transduction histidine kinase